MADKEYGKAGGPAHGLNTGSKDGISTKPSRTLLSGVDFVVTEFREVDGNELEEMEEDSVCADNILTYSSVRAEYESIRKYVRGIDENFESLPAETRFNKLAELRDRGGMDAEFAKIAVTYFTYSYSGGVLKFYKAYINENNRMDFFQEALLAAQKAFIKYEPGKTASPLQYFGKIIYEAIFTYVNNQIYGRSIFDAKQFIFVGRCMQELTASGITDPEAGDIALQQFLKVNVDRNRMNVGKIRYFMEQLSISSPTTSIYNTDDDGEEGSLLDIYDASDSYSYGFQDPEDIAIDSQVLAEVYRAISRMVRDERDARAFICSRYMNLSIEEIRDRFYRGESISRDTISRRLNALAQKIAKSDDITKIRFGINEVTEYRPGAEATIASTDGLLDDIAQSDAMTSLYAGADYNLRGSSF